MSLETIGSSVYSSTRSSGGLAAASAKAALTSATDGLPCTTAVKSVMEPAGSGTRSEVPSRRPFMAASTRLVARAAPVEVGTMLIGRGPRPAQVLVRQVEQVLVVGVGVHRRHEPAHDVEGRRRSP